jgi:hypothetical protein
MANWVIGKCMALGFTAAVVAASGLGGVAFSRLVAIQRGAEDIAREVVPGVHEILQLATTVETERALTREYILASGPAERAMLEQTTRNLSQQTDRALKEYQAATHTVNDRALLKAIQTAMVPMREARDATLALSREDRSGEAHALLESLFLPGLDNYLAAVAEALESTQGNGHAFNRSITALASSAQFGLILVLLLAVGASTGFEWVIDAGERARAAAPSDMAGPAVPVATAGADYPLSRRANRGSHVKTSVWWPEAVGCSSLTVNSPSSFQRY